MSRISFMIQSRMKNKGRSLVANSFFKGVQNELVGGTIRYMITGGGHILPESMRTINRIGYPLFNGFRYDGDGHYVCRYDKRYQQADSGQRRQSPLNP